jgi:MFS family permease
LAGGDNRGMNATTAGSGPRGDQPERSLASRLGTTGLLVLMSIGGFAMWIVTPVAWLWIGSQLTESRRPDGTLYVFVAVGLIGTMAILGLLLGRMNRIHGALTGRLTERTIASSRVAWHRPQSASDEGRSPVNALEVIMVACVVIAGVLFFVWFFFFAGSSLDYQI